MRLIVLFLSSYVLLVPFSFGQCFEPDASIWLNSWASCAEKMNPILDYGESHWIQYDFGSVRALSKSWVWNTNNPEELDQGFKRVKVDYSKDGVDWKYWGEMEFPKAQGEAIYSGFPGPDLQGVKARYVLLTALSNHGHASCHGLAEVKFNLLPDNEARIPPKCGANAEFVQSGIQRISSTEAVVFWEYSEEVNQSFAVHYKEFDKKWTAIYTRDNQVRLTNLKPGALYQFRVETACEEVPIFSELDAFTTLNDEEVNCADLGFNLAGLKVVTTNSALLHWQTLMEGIPYTVELREVGKEWSTYNVDKEELLVEQLEPGLHYEFRVAFLCASNAVRSKIVSFSTLKADHASPGQLVTADQVSLFPNPTLSRLNLLYAAKISGELNITLSSTQGQILWKEKVRLFAGANAVEVNLSDFPSGIYVLQLEHSDGSRFLEKIVRI